MAAGAEADYEGVAMSKNQRQQPRKPATKLPNLQEKCRSKRFRLQNFEDEMSLEDDRVDA